MANWWPWSKRSGSFCSSNDPRVHFGMAAETTIEELAVTWTDGRRQVFKLFPRTVSQLKAQILESQGEWSAALERFQSHLRLNPHSI